jgi:DNA-directed RNA polymerase specialized sigma subunit
MWKAYREITRRYQKIPLSEERRLIREAQNGSDKSREELVLRHISFLLFRIHKRVFPKLVKRFGEDLLADSILILYKKVESYDLNYCTKRGHPKPVKFISYIWKRIDGFILDFLKKEIEKEKMTQYEED